MTLDGFLTFLTLIIAAYAIVPSVARLRLRLHMRWPAIISLVGFGLVIYFEFFPLLALPCPKAFGNFCRYLNITPDSPIKPGQIAFIVVIAWLLFGWIAFARSKVSPRAFPVMSRLVSELAYEQRHAELVKLIEPHLVLLNQAAKRELNGARLHDFLRGLDGRHLPMHKIVEQMEKGETPFSERSFVHRAIALAGAKLACLVPAQRRAEEAAKEIYRILFHSPELTRFIALSQPYFGVRLLSCSVTGVDDFCADYLTELVSNNRSTLYTEIEHNQNTRSNGNYEFPKHNQLLHFFFDNAKTAERLAVWKPVGEYLISALRPSNAPDYVRYLNGPADSFENEKWKDRTFITIRFFDLMVNAAEHQGIQWHMWLYYFKHFLERIIVIYDASGADIDLTDEWPTRASYLIYDMFSAMTGWIEAVGSLRAESPHLVLTSANLTHENGNIPKSAALELGACLQILVTADSIDEHFKGYIHDIVISTVRNMNESGVQGRYREILIKSIIEGGLHRPTPAYGVVLKRLWDATDHVVRADMKKYHEELLKAYS